MARPTFLIIGGMKCGTTSLHHYLSEHPDIQDLPAMKETNFFSGPPEAIPYPPGTRRITDQAKYEQLFDASYAVRGEASPCYALYPRRRGVPERIRQFVPDVKLIYLVRDPVERAVSQYRFSVSVEGEPRTMEEALSAFDDPTSLYTCPGFYAAQLDRYLEHFPMEQIMVVDQSDLYARRQVTMSEIFSFLEVDSTFASSTFEEEFNAGAERRSYSPLIIMQRRLRTTFVHRLPRQVRRPLRRSIERVVTRRLEQPELSEELGAKLRELYAPEVERLRSLTGKDLSDWSL